MCCFSVNWFSSLFFSKYLIIFIRFFIISSKHFLGCDINRWIFIGEINQFISNEFWWKNLLFILSLGYILRGTEFLIWEEQVQFQSLFILRVIFISTASFLLVFFQIFDIIYQTWHGFWKQINRMSSTLVKTYWGMFFWLGFYIALVSFEDQSLFGCFFSL